MPIWTTRNKENGETVLRAFDEESGLWAEDHGGPYIDLGNLNEDIPVDVVNCWDYEAGSRAKDHPFTSRHLKKRLKAWVDE